MSARRYTRGTLCEAKSVNNMKKEENLIKNIETLVILCKSRKTEGRDDEKRHDKVQRDEQKGMWTAYTQLDWSFAKIGSKFDRDPRTVKEAVENHEINTNKKTANKQQQNDVLDIIGELKAFMVTVCNKELDALEILYQLRGRLTEGIKSNEVLGAITDRFGGSIIGESSESSFEVFNKLSLLKIVDLHQRREGRPVSYDVGFWVLTDFGKDVIRYIDKNKLSS